MCVPTTSGSRSRRRTSTSGSSGIDAVALDGHRGLAFERLCVVGTFAGREIVVDPRPRRARGRLFGLLLRSPLAVTQDLAPQRDRGEEMLGVVGTLGVHAVPRNRLEPLGGELLEPGLEVVNTRALGVLANPRLEQAPYELVGREPAAVQVHRAEDGLERVREDRRFLTPARALLALPQRENRTELRSEEHTSELQSHSDLV